MANQTIVMHPYLPERYEGMYTSTIKKNTGLPQVLSPPSIVRLQEDPLESVFRSNATLAYDIPGVDGLVAKVAGVYD